MKRRSKACGKLPKAHRRKVVSKRGKTPVSRRRSAVSDQKTEIARLARERDEALEQQAATADVLTLLSGATFDLQSVLDKVAESAARLCNAEMAGITREHEGAYYYASVYNYPSHLHEFMRNARHERTRGSVTGRALLEGVTVHVHDVTRDSEYTMQDFAQKVGIRTALGVPLLRDGVAIGVIVLARRQVRPFNEREIELVRTFAAQAVIAIENARLLNELRQSLEQQTATADVLHVISTSTNEIKPVFDAMLQNALRLCEAKFAMLFLYEGNEFRAVATRDVPPAWSEYLANNPILYHPSIPMARAASTKQPVHIADATADPAYIERRPGMVGLVELGGGRTLLQVPMVKDDEILGMIGIYRQEVRPFSNRQIELVKNFANQAVIAIENTRLLNELRQRTTDLTESLEQQTATADVLRVISSSPTDIQPVLEAIVRTAGKLCDAEYAMLYRLRDGKYHPACWNNAVSEWVKYLLDHPLSVGRGSLVGRAALERRTVHILDCLADPEYTMHEAARIGNQRTMLGVPLLHDGVPIGV
ncbi:MAG: GAF domain-containing protein, partial [Rhizobiales bacterium]|nr:GAF domain-containing protein [Hyphomicrobiales bacterium]